MNTGKTRIHFLLSTLIMPALLIPVSPAHSEQTLTGRINGLHCATEGEFCPIDKLDPHLVLEPDFVLQTAEGEYYFLPNMRRETKMRYVLDQVQVTGTVNNKYNNVQVDEFRVKKGDSYKTVWSEKMQQDEWNIWYRQAE